MSIMMRTRMWWGLALSSLSAIVIWSFSHPSEDSPFLKHVLTRLEAYHNTRAAEKVYVHINQTLLHPGEDIWYTVYVRDANTLAPSVQSRTVYVELLDPKGGVLAKYALEVKDGVATGDFALSEDALGGLYTLKAYTKWQQNTETVFERTLQVQQTVLPNLSMKLEFVRKAYGAGQQVLAYADFMDLSNKPLVEQAVDYVVQLDGQQYIAKKAKTDKNGRVYMQFDLPNKLETTAGLLFAQVRHNGIRESISRSIPIVLGDVQVRFFPESGDLVAGLPTRVAFEAKNMQGKAADIAGVVVDEAGKTVAEVESYHEGRGAFQFTPQAGMRYHLALTRPEVQQFDLPSVKKEGYTLDVRGEEDYIKLKVNSTEKGQGFVVVQSGGVVRWASELAFDGTTQSFDILTADWPMGVAQVTLFDAKQQPRAERLTFVQQYKQLDISIQTNKEKYLPREEVKYTLSVKDEEGAPVQGIFSMAVVNEKLLSFADDKQGNILAAMYLESEVKGTIESPNFYFDQTEAKSAQALEYLLMTQGWRRFDWEDCLAEKPFEVKYKAEKPYVKGRVLDYQGNPLSNVTVRLGAVTQQTSKNGAYAFEAVRIDSVVFVEVEHRGELRRYPIWQHGEHIDLYWWPDVRGKKLRGKVIGMYQGKALGGVEIFSLPSKTKLGTTDKNGNFSVKMGKESLLLFSTGDHILYYTTQRIEDWTKRQHIEIFDEPILYEEEDQMYMDIEMTTEEALPVDAMPPPPPPPAPLNVPSDELLEVRREKVEEKEEEEEIINPTQALDKIARRLEHKDRLSTKVKKRRFMADAFELPCLSCVEIADEVDAARCREEAGWRQFYASFDVPEAWPKDTTIWIEGTAYADQNDVLYSAGMAPSFYFEYGSELFAAAFFELPYIKTEGRSFKFYNEFRLPIRNTLSKGAELLKRATDNRKFYVPNYKPEEEVQQRTDFRSTIYWNPRIYTNAQGQATGRFVTSDEITSFRITVEGATATGKLGHKKAHLYTQQAFSVHTRLPHQVVSGDEIALPVTLVNNTSRHLTGQLNIQMPSHFQASATVPTQQTLEPNERRTLFLKYRVGEQAGAADIQVGFQAGRVKDAARQVVHTKMRGYPVAEVFSSESLKSKHKFEVKAPIKGSLRVRATAYPAVLDNVMDGMDKMLRQPTGCFEQTSSSNYPNVLALQYLRATSLSRPEIEARATQLLEAGYKRLLTYEIEGGGFDIWGQGPAHEGLSAYGLVQFFDMKSVYPVEEALLTRTATWLLSRRKGDGSWNHENSAGHGFVQMQAVADAYLTYALAVSGYGDAIKKEIDKSYQDALISEDPYLMALVANSLLAVQDYDRADKLLQDLVKRQNKNGSWEGLTHSITNSRGQSLHVETTSFTVLALLQRKGYKQAINSAMDFIAKCKTSYGFGSTQTTILALKALVAHAQHNKRMPSTGEFVVAVNGKTKATIPYSTEQHEPLVVDLSKYCAEEGNYKVELKLAKTKEPLPLELEVAYTTTQPVDVGEQLALSTELARTTLKMGDYVRFTAHMQNKTKGVLASPMLVVGLPAGLSLQPWQLKQLQEEGAFRYYELFDGYAVFHYSTLPAGATQTVNLDLKADISGTYEAPASTAFLYYDHEQRVWAKPQKVNIKQ